MTSQNYDVISTRGGHCLTRVETSRAPNRWWLSGSCLSCLTMQNALKPTLTQVAESCCRRHTPSLTPYCDAPRKRVVWSRESRQRRKTSQDACGGLATCSARGRPCGYVLAIAPEGSGCWAGPKAQDVQDFKTVIVEATSDAGSLVSHWRLATCGSCALCLLFDDSRPV